MDLHRVIDLLRCKRKVFHSEADFQFTLAWEIQVLYPKAEIRLEVPCFNNCVDILVINEGRVFPIELKYKTKLMSAVVNGESFHLKNHGAQDLGKYDFVKDICRIESLVDKVENFSQGFALWLTNEPSYWKPPQSTGVGYFDFSVHNGSKKTGVMAWGESVGTGTTRGRESKLTLSGEYEIEWKKYSDLNISNSLFKYAVAEIQATRKS